MMSNNGSCGTCEAWRGTRRAWRGTCQAWRTGTRRGRRGSCCCWRDGTEACDGSRTCCCRTRPRACRNRSRSSAACGSGASRGRCRSWRIAFGPGSSRPRTNFAGPSRRGVTWRHNPSLLLRPWRPSLLLPPDITWQNKDNVLLLLYFSTRRGSLKTLSMYEVNLFSTFGLVLAEYMTIQYVRNYLCITFEKKIKTFIESDVKLLILAFMVLNMTSIWSYLFCINFQNRAIIEKRGNLWKITLRIFKNKLL